MDSLSNLKQCFKLIFSGGDGRKLNEIISQETSGLNSCQMREDNCNTDFNVHNLEKVLSSLDQLLHIFHSNYESRFSIYVEYIFQEIQRLLNFAACNNILSSVPLVEFINVFTSIANLCISHLGDDKILVNFYTENMNEINSIYNSDCDISPVEELVWRLKITSVFYEILCHVEQDANKNKNLYTYIDGENLESSLFSKLLTSNSDIVVAETLINVIPKFAKFSRNGLILQYIWNELANLMPQQNSSKSFTILCYLSEFYFLPENTALIGNIFKDNNYWNILQRGLINPDSLIRKQALYLMKLTLNYCTENFVVIGEVKPNVNMKDLDFYIVESEIENLKELCVIIEFLEEKQVHIIQPIFNIIEKFVEKCTTMKRSTSWTMIMIQRMVCHDNMKVVRFGISNFLKIPITTYQNEDEMVTAIKLLVSSLNSIQIYMTELSAILEELGNYFKLCSKAQNGEIFFRFLLQEICNEHWSSEALFFIIYSLQSVKLKMHWNQEELDQVKNLIICGAANHYTYVKSAMQCQLLLFMINLLDTKNISLYNIDSFLNCFHKKMSLQRGTSLWYRVVSWVKDSYTVTDLENYIMKSITQIEHRNVVKIIMIAYDAYKNDENFFQNILQLLKRISESFIDIHVRCYCNVDVQEFYLSVICDLIRESNNDLDLLKCFTPFLSDIILYIECQLNCINHIKDVQRSQNLLNNLGILLSLQKNSLSLFSIVNKWIEKVCKFILSIDSYSDFPVKKFIAIRTLNFLMGYCPKFAFKPDIVSYLIRNLNSPLLKTPEECNLSKQHQTLWGRMNSEYIEGNWKLLSDLTDLPIDDLGLEHREFLDFCFEALDIGGYTALPSLMCVLGKALLVLPCESKLEELIEDIWNVIMERKKNEDFPRLTKMFVETIFQEDLLRNENSCIQKILIKYSRRILSDATVNTTNIFIKRIQSAGGCQNTDFFLDFLPRALLYGQIEKKDERFFSEVCSFIEKKGLSPLANDCGTNAEVRARAIKILLTLNLDNEAHTQFTDNLLEALIRMEESINKNKTRYFSGSYTHRVKQRLMQSLLILVHLAPRKSQNLWQWVSNKIITENNQPSIRYLQEWLMLRIIHINSELRESIWEYFDEGLEKRTGSLCSLISVIYHTIQFLPSELTVTWIDTAIQTFLPYCMAQHFSVRLYAQVSLQKLLILSEERGLISIVQKYDLVRKSLSQSIERGNAIKNCTKIQEDFYFTAFDPIEHYSLDTIFFDIPRLTNVCSEEWISDELFRKCGVEGNCHIPLKSKNESLKSFEAGKWILEGSKQDFFIGDCGPKESLGITNFQKKMIPVKSVAPNFEELYHSIKYCSRMDTDKDGLVVVASLVDRIPNLGGLTRTCEVFGVSELVISSLKHIEDKQFQNLSVTAEKWISISEVKPFHLTEYLIKMKEKGYTILAAEQTINSKPLQSVTFPKKTLLLLGNEKEGIPPTLLPLTDACVEVPQVGVIRSLNVHVTGALFIWEYARQHRFISNSSF